jgi:hypothetical protein
MPPPWKPPNGFHSGLEISRRTRDSHISTADHRQVQEQITTEDWTAATDSGTLSARSDEGTLGGKVLKTLGPYLLQTDTAATDERDVDRGLMRRICSIDAPPHGTKSSETPAAAMKDHSLPPIGAGVGQATVAVTLPEHSAGAELGH